MILKITIKERIKSWNLSFIHREIKLSYGYPYQMAWYTSWKRENSIKEINGYSKGIVIYEEEFFINNSESNMWKIPF